MPYRPEAELKRPDLKGEFLCGHCGKTFCHAASLNRHRLNFHGDDQQCQLCNIKIAAHETVRRHMAVNHQITRVFTCGCCNWTFPDKKELHAHNNSMLRTGQPGDARAIAISNRPPGSLAQAELKTEEGASMINRNNFNSPPPKQARKKVEGSNVAEILLKQMMSQQTASTTPVATTPSLTPVPNNEWLQTFLLNNPNIIPFLSMMPGIKQEEPQAPSPLETLFASNNNNNNNTIKYNELNVKTEPEETSSGPESGIGSGEDVTDSSPVPSDSSKESSPPGDSTKFSRKRKSVDAIASFLFQRKQCASAAQ